ncbi:class A beta-lactamase-related serine hydrolase [Mycobacterium parmense]|uniref:class A beta-lactamase-related serine hydrolase n=1 Tax=Mycobacterium parmense TaxID=185642 RepID=UPI000A22AF76|nr:class A beta-lactamase-related serine hydrolase [Mycobacterium parmense]ORW59272.1 hypothetical protein AWC20_10015 [Mycobacterium parmense]
MVAALLGIGVVTAVLVADNGVRPGSLAALVGDFPELQSSVDASIGIALTPVGGRGAALELGEWRSGPAWSTMKVPLVIAALRDEDRPVVSDEMTVAITQSDNAAAEAIWAGLGDPPTAAGKVEAVLSETGDPTRVQFRRVRPEYSAFGQTDWSLPDQATFLAAAACDHRDAAVFALMGRIEPDQRWGLGTIAGTPFKGGWGPSPAHRYLQRQMGVITTPAGSSAVALAAEPHSGASVDGISALNRIAAWLRDHLVMLPRGHCPG